MSDQSVRPAIGLRTISSLGARRLGRHVVMDVDYEHSRGCPRRVASPRIGFRMIRQLRGAWRWGSVPRIEADRSAVRAPPQQVGRGDSTPQPVRDGGFWHQAGDSPLCAKPGPAVALWPELDGPDGQGIASLR